MTANAPTAGTIGNVGRHAAYVEVDGVELGYTMDGYSFLNDIGLSNIQFDQDPTPQGQVVDTQSITLELTIAEVTNTNMDYYFGGLGTIDGSKFQYGDQKGQALPTYEIKLFPMHAIGHPFSGRVLTLFKCNIVPNGPFEIDPTKDGFEGFPVKIVALKDSTQTAGEEFFTFDAVVTTAPTVSSTSPVDNATGVAVAAVPTVTFDMAMGLASFMADETVQVHSVGMTSTAFTDKIAISGLSLNAAGTVLSIAHAADAFGALTEYQIVISAVRSANGVPLAAPYVFTFTTA